MHHEDSKLLTSWSKRGSVARMIVALGAIVTAAWSAPARACSVCNCGDPLVAAAEGHGRGVGDLRLALDGEYLSQEAGSEGAPGMTDVLDQYTLRVTGVYSPVTPLNLVVAVPFVRKKMMMDHGNGTTDPMSDLSGLGDVEVAARYFVLESVDFGAKRRQGFAISVGTSIPTGENDARDAAGERIDEHGQIGTGGWGPYVGVSYRLQQDPWNALVSVTGRLRTENAHEYRFGNALLWTVQGQWAPRARLALGLGLEGRQVARDTDAGEIVENTGGLVLAATPSVYVNAYRGLWFSVRAQLPFYSRLEGEQKVGPNAVAGFAYQL